jgi:hypothetical protein
VYSRPTPGTMRVFRGNVGCSNAQLQLSCREGERQRVRKDREGRAKSGTYQLEYTSSFQLAKLLNTCACHVRATGEHLRTPGGLESVEIGTSRGCQGERGRGGPQTSQRSQSARLGYPEYPLHASMPRVDRGRRGRGGRQRGGGRNDHWPQRMGCRT